MLRVDRRLFESADVALAEFRVLPGHASWGRRNRTSDGGSLIVFPRTPVGIEQIGRGRVVADSMRVLFYPPCQEYRRELISDAGDRCSYIAVSPVLLAEATGGDLPFIAAQLTPSDFFLHQTVRRRTIAGQADPDEIREALLLLVAQALAAAGASFPRGTGRTDVVEETRRFLAGDLDQRLSLDEVAHTVHVSPFHLSRVFRQRTGTSIHAYRTSLRLRASLEPIADGQPIAHVAADLGFASHAHLTDRFHRSFGMSPQSWRANLRLGRIGKEQDRESLRGRAAIA
jgi:AraC-like DNA-binding protein